MKQEKETKESQENTIDFSRNNSFNSNDKIRDDMIIADLKMRLKILKDGVIDERKKNSELAKEIEKLKEIITQQENLLIEKEKEIRSITNDKLTLISKLSFEMNKSENPSQQGKFSHLISGIFNKKDEPKSFENELANLQKLNEDLKSENLEFKKKIEEQANSVEITKTEYQNFIGIQIEEIKKLKNQIDEKNKNIEEKKKKMEIFTETLKYYDIEKVRLEAKIFDLENLMVSSKTSSQEIILKLNKDIDSHKEEINDILKHTSNYYRKTNFSKFYESDVYAYLYAHISNFRGNVKTCVLVKNNLDSDLIYSNLFGSISGWFVNEEKFYEKAFGHDGSIKPGWCGGFNHIKKRDTACGSVGFFGFNFTHNGEDFHAMCGFSNAYSGMNSVGVKIDKGYYTSDSINNPKVFNELVTMEYYKGDKGPYCSHIKVFEAYGISVKAEFLGYGTPDGTGNNSFYFEFNKKIDYE